MQRRPHVLHKNWIFFEIPQFWFGLVPQFYKIFEANALSSLNIYHIFVSLRDQEYVYLFVIILISNKIP